MASVHSVANFFIKKRHKITNGFSATKLHKMIYFSHSFCLAHYDYPLIDENFQAWGCGPMLVSLYHDLSKFGNHDVNELLSRYDDGDCPGLVWHCLRKTHPNLKSLKSMVKHLGQHTEMDLIRASTHEDEAWYKTLVNYGIIKSGEKLKPKTIIDRIPIDNNIIKTCAKEIWLK
jgi:uncharacterized phage-associated protein